MNADAGRALLRAEGRATAADSKRVFVHAFEVPAGVEGLTLAFDYGPRRATDAERNRVLVEAAIEQHARRREQLQAGAADVQRQEFAPQIRALNNLMNVALIDPQGRWRGRWDRNPSSDQGALFLGREHASKGFLPGALPEGRWTAAVECHGVFGEPVSFHLEVDAVTPPPTPEASAPLPAPPDRRRGPGWYFGEMHSHTVHSDGKHELAELARRGAALGLDFLALTDHNTTSGLLEADGVALTIVPGCELTTFHGHHPIYGLTDIVPWHEEGRVLGLSELAPGIRARGGVVSVAHPFKIGDPICTGCRMPDDLDPASFDLLEVWYRGWDAADSDNEAAYALWNELWRRGRRVTAVGARDWHGPGQETPFPGAAPFTGVYAEDNTPEAIVDGLRRGEVIMTGGPTLDLSLTSAGASARIAQTLRAAKATVRLHVQRLEAPAELRLFRSGERVRTLPVEGDGLLELEGIAEGPGWYRAELWRGPEPLCLTNHVLLEAEPS